MIELFHADAVEWAKEYSQKISRGETQPFHALLCDPPYELGFMGKDWDKSGVTFRPDTWAALTSVLHEGAFVMAFASSRGWHKMAVAMEDAGLVIHPSIFGWAFGCLSEDTEILTKDGWKPYTECLHGCMVMCYNVKDSTFNYMPVEETFEYDYDEIAYAIKSEHTDQLVSRNHRVIAERDGKQTFVFAEQLQAKEKIYIVGETQGHHELQSGARQKQARHGYRLPCLWQRNLQAVGVDSENKNGRLLFSLMQGKGKFESLATAQPQGAECMDRKERGELPRKDERRKQSRVERRRNLFSQAWQLCTDKIRSVSSAVFSNGAQGWLRYGTSAYSSASVGAVSDSFGSGASCELQPARQPIGESNVVRQQLGTQELRSAWQAVTTLATVTPVHYRGKVWCVKVPTGAFVARRNGKAFVTGNSGFPKATRIDTQVDKAAGAEREVVGDWKPTGTARPNKGKRGHNAAKTTAADAEYDPDDSVRISITAPATPLASAWAGHRYGLQALKPALEPIIVAQKPYKGKAWQCITRTGAGALNIDGARIGVSDVKDGLHRKSAWSNHAESKTFHGQAYKDMRDVEVPLGRFPANFVLSHAPQCEERDGAWVCADGCAVQALGEQSGELKAGVAVRHNSGENTFGGENKKPLMNDLTYNDTGSAARFFYNADWSAEVEERLEAADPVFYCAKASRRERDSGLDEMSDRKQRDEWTTILDSYPHMEDGYVYEGKPIKNPHTTVKPIALAKYLATLLLPPVEYAPRRLFVPFAGVASECIGASKAGWDEIVGVELTEEYIPIARTRIAYWENKEIKPKQSKPVVSKPKPIKNNSNNKSKDKTNSNGHRTPTMQPLFSFESV